MKIFLLVFAVLFISDAYAAKAVGEKFKLKKEVGELGGKGKISSGTEVTLIDIEVPVGSIGVYIYTFQTSDGKKFNVGAASPAFAEEWMKEKFQ